MARGSSAASTAEKVEPEAPKGGDEPPASEAPDGSDQPAEVEGAQPGGDGIRVLIPDEGDVTVIVAIAIGGTRNGEPWPAVGEPITLPAVEAAGYLQFGYVLEPESEPDAE